MKYSQLISFNPIEDVIQLVTAENKDKAREYVKTYVMSDSMADALQAPMIDQFRWMRSSIIKVCLLSVTMVPVNRTLCL